MCDRFISMHLLNEIPRPLIYFIWYLWDVYCDPTANESLFLLKPGITGQRVTIQHINKTIEQDFGTAIEVTVTIQKNGSKYHMSRQ